MGPSTKAEKKELTVHVVSHTHWDREWYHTAAVFRQRLVALIDYVLESGRTDPKLRFLLDGQAVVIEDYLAVRPERKAELAARLRSGAIEAGPWYVLADELIPDGEDLVRNLLAGKRSLDAIGARAPKTLYCPDSFGHPAALPAIASGFGCELIILWRGFGGASHPATNCAHWRAPDHSAAVLYHLPRDGYELGAELTTNAGDSAARWTTLRASLSERDSSNVVLLTNGADHHALQYSAAAAIKTLAQVARPDVVVRSTLSDFAAALLRRVRRLPLPMIEGELRDSYGYTWALQGTFASRSQLKRSLALASRILTREVEPWSALAAARNGVSRRHLVHAAWKSLLLALPHDTICGCSVDEVAADAAQRLRDATDEGRHLARAAIAELAGYDTSIVRGLPHDSSGDVVVLTNPSCRARGGVVEISLVQKRRDIKVGPGSEVQPHAIFRTPAPKSFALSRDTKAARLPAQILGSRSRYDLIESPHHYPDADIVMERRILVWSPPIPGYGLDSIRSAPANALGEALRPVHPAVASERSIGNELVSAGITRDNRVWLGIGKEQRVYVRVEDQYDAGDLYTPSLRHSAMHIERARSWKVAATGPLRSCIVVRYEWSAQVEKSDGSEIVTTGSKPLSRARQKNRISQLRGSLEITLSVDASSPFVKIGVAGDNRTKHHRLRLVISGDMAGARTFADCAFAVLERSPVLSDESSRKMEIPPATEPLHRFVSLLSRKTGMTIFSDGCREYETRESGRVSLTLLRAVGELSRHDLPERPGHAGWPANTPLAQELGPFHCSFAWLPHPGGAWDKIAPIVERAAEDFLHPLSGTTLRSAVIAPQRMLGAELNGEGLSVTAIKESEDGKSLVLRCVNLTGKRIKGHWQLGHAVRKATLARLDESPLRKLAVKGGNCIAFVAEAHGIVTILVS